MHASWLLVLHLVGALAACFATLHRDSQHHLCLFQLFLHQLAHFFKIHVSCNIHELFNLLRTCTLVDNGALAGWLVI